MDVSNKKRFKEEYGEEPSSKPPNLHRPDDHHAVFSGNVDDHFRIGGSHTHELMWLMWLMCNGSPPPPSLPPSPSLGMSILKRSMRLYSPFYSSDIIIASPLGLRTLIGIDGEAQRDFDFLSSVELLVLEQTDVFLMQNWEHVLVRNLEFQASVTFRSGSDAILLNH